MYYYNVITQRMKVNKSLLVASCFLIIIFGFSGVLKAAPRIQLEPIISGLNRPVAITHAGDNSGRLFITLLGGQIIIFDGERISTEPFLDISSLISAGGERGLFSVAFHPDYASNGFLFVSYTDKNGKSVIARYTVSADPNRVDTNSAAILLTVEQPQPNHNGGQLQFGPDGFLYIGMGDGGGAGDPDDKAQDLSSLLGKILRIEVAGDPAYGIPADNPFNDDPTARDEIWALGLRNPWRFSFDRLTGDLFIADVGQGNREEVSYQPVASQGGENYGWPLMEGSDCFKPSENCSNGELILPILEYDHSLGCSITGGYRYRGGANPGLSGIYFYGDFCTGRIWGAAPDDNGVWLSEEILATGLRISTFGEDENGEIYLAHFSDGEGTIYRISEADIKTGCLFSDDVVPRYRLYNPNDFHHHYTSDANEYNTLGDIGWIQEGTSSCLYDEKVTIGSVDAVPYLRLYNPYSYEHHWTADANEYNVLATIGWIQEGVDGYVFPSQVSGSEPLHRLYNPNNGLHLWTMDANEKEVLIDYGFIDEGIACFVFR